MINKPTKAFTLIELLVVVAIIGILAAVGVVAYNGYTASAKESAVRNNLKSVAKEAKTNPKRWIEQRIYDKKISTNSDFLVAFDRWLLMIWSDGLSATIKYYLSKV